MLHSYQAYHSYFQWCSDAEKFYPEFYKVLSDAENPFTGLSRHSTFLVGFELANHGFSPAHHTGCKFQDDKMLAVTN